MSKLDQIMEHLSEASKSNPTREEKEDFSIKATHVGRPAQDRVGSPAITELNKSLQAIHKENPKDERLPAWFVRHNTQTGGVKFEDGQLIKCFDWPFREAPGVLQQQLPKVYENYCMSNVRFNCLDELVEYIPEHRIYVESDFVGMLFRKNRSPIEIVNDRRQEAVMFWRYMQFYPEQIAEALEDMPISQWYKYEFVGKWKHYDAFLQAVMFWYYHKYPEIRGTLDELKTLHERIKHVDFRCEDQHRTISSTAGEDTFIFAFGEVVPEKLEQSKYLWVHEDNDHGHFLLDRFESCSSFIKQMTFMDKEYNFIVGTNCA